MKRLSVLLLALLLGPLASLSSGQQHTEGWDAERGKKEADKLAQITDPLYGFQVQKIMKSVEDEQKTVLLYRYKDRLGLRTHAWDQGNFGSCVGFAGARALTGSYCVQVCLGGSGEKFESAFSPMAVYGMSRQISGTLGGWQGSTGAWACRAMREWGTLLQKRYDHHDLSKYDISLLRRWQRQGLPDYLIEISKEHPCLATTRVKSVEEAKALLQNGYGILTCSLESYGSGKRDGLGFAQNDGRNAWAHAMYVGGYRGPPSGREGFLIINSWGQNFGSGPKWPEDQPDGSFWVTVGSFRQHIKAGDTWAVGDIEGFRERALLLREAIDVGGREIILK